MLDMLPVTEKQDLTVYNFFTNFISDPLSSKLSQVQKIVALIASIILAPLTLGILHCVTTIWRHRRIEYYQQKEIYSQGRLASLIQKIQACPNVVALNPLSRPGVLTRETLGHHIQSELINPYYSKPLPSFDSVTVPVETTQPDGVKKVEWKLWKDLSAEEKICVNNTGTRPHNQLHGPLAPLIVDLAFSPPLSGSGVQGDPRGVHGGDHAIRASLFSAVFAFLYQKYHPEYQVTEKDILLTQFVAAGHDSERQTEGADVYDQKSAEITNKALQKLGVSDQKDLKACFQAIAEKDDRDLGRKSFIAKCVQNADSMEFSRVWLQDSLQDPTEFEKSRGFLDIYKEFQEIQQSGRELKNGSSFEEFQTELDALRVEMNGFIALTCRQKFRKKASESGNYYAYVLRRIRPYNFPLLHAALQKMNVLPQECNESQKVDLAAEAESLVGLGVEKTSTPFLQRLLHKLQGLESERLVEVRTKIEQELHRRASALQCYTSTKERSQDTVQLIESYAKLPPILQDDISLLAELHVSSFESLEQEIRDVVDHSSLAFRFVELKRQILFLNELVATHPEDPGSLFERAQQVFVLYGQFPPEYRDPRDQTSVAIALQLAARMYHTQQNAAKFEEVVHFAEERLIPDSHLEDIVKRPSPQVYILELGTDEIRKQRVRVEQKKIDEMDFIEISFEVTSTARNNLIVQSSGPLYRVSHVPSHFEKREGEGRYTSEGTDLPLLCQDACMTLDDSGSPSLSIGESSIFWNQYHLVRLRFSRTTPLKEAQKLLCRIGLFTAMMPPRQEDVRQCNLARILAMRYPKTVYVTEPKKSPQYIYETLLSQGQRARVDEDLRQLRRGFTGDAIEIVHPEFVREIWEKGGRSLAVGVDSGSMQATAKVLSNIFSSGFLSAQERYQRGILAGGTVPYINNWAGSANQVFTRILTHQLFQESCELRRFYMPGRAFVLLGLQACERLPYAYPQDLSGVRNKGFFFPAWTSIGNHDIKLPFRGRTAIQDREDLPEFVRQMTVQPRLNNECMFDRSLGVKYVRKIIVGSGQDRAILLDALYKNNIRFSHGQRLEDMIVVSDKLTPELEEAFSEQPREELK
jgi:hypothetical protein